MAEWRDGEGGGVEGEEGGEGGVEGEGGGVYEGIVEGECEGGVR